MSGIAILLITLLFYSAIAEIGNAISKLGDDIKISHGYIEECVGPWYSLDCKWVLSEEALTAHHAKYPKHCPDSQNNKGEL